MPGIYSDCSTREIIILTDRMYVCVCATRDRQTDRQTD